MARLLITSDLHFEFHRDAGAAFTASLPDAVEHRIDAIVVAGDLMPERRLSAALGLFCDRYPQVIFVAGNHELYGSRPDLLAATRMAAQDRFRNLSWLEREVVEVGGVRILGTSLWFRRDPLAPRSAMNDFQAIKNFEPWVYRENEMSVEFIHRELAAGDVLVTHHLPTQRSVDPRYDGSPLNAFFVCDVEPLISDRAPTLVVHGHTHSKFDYLLPNGVTRVVCNPYGYDGHERHENAAFDRSLIVDVSPPGSEA